MSARVVEHLDIWRTAHILMKEYGDEASWVAAQRSDAFLDQGEVVASRIWTRVFCAIDWLESGPRAGDTIN